MLIKTLYSITKTLLVMGAVILLSTVSAKSQGFTSVTNLNSLLVIPNPPILVSPSDNAPNVSTSPLLSVTVTDPEALPVKVSFYGKAISTAGEDFTVIGFPDTQYYSASANGGTPDMFNDQTLWVKNNQVTENIVFVSHAGDVIDVDSDTQWRIANTAMSTLDVGANIPFGISIGNHDATSGSSALYNNYFGVSRFTDRDYYGGSYGSDNDNNYEKFRAGGMDFMIIHLEYDPDTSAIQWADMILKANADRKAIVTSHSIINTGNPATFTPIGSAIYEELKDNPNLFLMLCGHMSGTGIRSDTYNGNTIYTLLADYQSSITNGGNGYMRIMEFSPQNDLITVKTYSPHLDAWMNDADNQFTVPYNMDGNGYDLIGTNTGVASGSTTSITWSGLSSGTEYEWYVKVSNGISTVTGPVWSFTTGGLTWDGSENRDWSNAFNWTGDLIPGSETDVTITAIPENQPIILASTAADCRNLTIKSGASLTIESSLTESDLTPSGSLIVHENAAGNVTYNRQMRTETNNGDYHYFASPVVSNPNTNSGKIADVWQWNEVTDSWSSLGINGLTSLQPGKGYNLDQTTGSDGIISFTGSILASNLAVDATSPYADVTDGTKADYDAVRDFANGSSHSGTTRDNDTYYGGGGWNMLGNPYTSAINAMAFVDYDRNENNFEPSYQAIYVYNGDVAGHNTFYYISKTTGWGDPAETHIQVGQGFFVLAMNDTSTFTFTRSMQDHSMGTVFLKSTGTKDRWPGLQLKAKSGEDENLTTVVFNEEMTVGLDPGYDIGLMGSSPGAVIYTALVEDNGVNFTRQALPMDGSVKNVIPVGVDFEKGGEIIFSADTEPLRNYKFWFEDRKTGTFTNLGTDTYSVFLPEKTYGTGRFFIIASTNTPTGIKQPEADDTGVRVWTSNDQVIIRGEVSDRAICEIYNVNGKKVLDKRLSGGELNTIAIPSGLKGVFIVRVTDGVKMTTRKIALL